KVVCDIKVDLCGRHSEPRALEAERKCGTQAKPPAPPRASHLHALVGQASACQRPLAGAFLFTFLARGCRGPAANACVATRSRARGHPLRARIGVSPVARVLSIGRRLCKASTSMSHTRCKVRGGRQ